jgi:hypothetical protein
MLIYLNEPSLFMIDEDNIKFRYEITFFIKEQKDKPIKDLSFALNYEVT